MKSLHLAAGISTTLLVSALAGIALNAGMALAQSDASSTAASASSADDSATVPALNEAASSPPSAPTASEAVVPLKLVGLVGTKYIDYCTDGTEVTSYPGDPAIDANLNKPDAPTPKCPDGLTWDHTAGMDAYETTSGDLEVGQYALQGDGTFAVHLPASIYKDATSTAELPDRIVVVSSDPTRPMAPADAPATADESTTTTEIQ